MPLVQIVSEDEGHKRRYHLASPGLCARQFDERATQIVVHWQVAGEVPGDCMC